MRGWGKGNSNRYMDDEICGKIIFMANGWLGIHVLKKHKTVMNLIHNVWISLL